MLYVRQPAMVINSYDVPGPHLKMRYTFPAPVGTNAIALVDLIRYSAMRAAAQGDPLLNVVINCHGAPGQLGIGGAASPMSIADVPFFETLKSFRPLSELRTLWITACKPARGPRGKTFCAALAKACGCRVVASEDLQYPDPTLARRNAELDYVASRVLGDIPPPFGFLDEYEGTTWQFEPSGLIMPCVPHYLGDSVLAAA